MKTPIFVLLFVLSQAMVVRAETLAEKQQRLEVLKQQVAQLEKEIASDQAGGAVKPPAAGASLERTLNALSKDLFPADNENEVKRELRNSWVDKNLRGEMGPWKFTGQIQRVDMVQRHVDNPAPGAPDTKSMVHVALTCPQDVTVWGVKLKAVKLDAYLESDIANDAANWHTDGSTTLTVSGKVTLDSMPDTTSDSINVKMEAAKLEK